MPRAAARGEVVWAIEILSKGFRHILSIFPFQSFKTLMNIKCVAILDRRFLAPTEDPYFCQRKAEPAPANRGAKDHVLLPKSSTSVLPTTPYIMSTGFGIRDQRRKAISFRDAGPSSNEPGQEISLFFVVRGYLVC